MKRSYKHGNPYRIATIWMRVEVGSAVRSTWKGKTALPLLRVPYFGSAPGRWLLPTLYLGEDNDGTGRAAKHIGELNGLRADCMSRRAVDNIWRSYRRQRAQRRRHGLAKRAKDSARLHQALQETEHMSPKRPDNRACVPWRCFPFRLETQTLASSGRRGRARQRHSSGCTQ